MMTDDNAKDKQPDWQQWHNKAGRSDYHPEPFYYWDYAIDDCPRIVAWSEDCRQMRAGFLALIDAFPETVEVLFKVRTTPVSDYGYDRWHSRILLKSLQEAVDEFAHYVFQQGYQVLCVLNKATDEYVALDEFGLLWYYSRSKAAENLLEQNGFSCNETPLVTAGGCYIASRENHSEHQKAFIARLGLEQVH